MPLQKMPAYFEKYLDEKFDNVVEKIKEVKNEVKGVKKVVNTLNGNVRENVKNTEKNRLYIKILGCFIVGIVIFVLGTVNSALLHVVKSVIALF